MIERLSGNDLAELAADVGPDPRLVGALVLLDGPALSLDRVRHLIAGHLTEAPLLSRTLRRVPFGTGRPMWSSVRPDLDHHVTARTCPGPGDEGALLDLVADLALEPLDMDRPLWRVVVVEGVADGGSALVWLSHHAAADGPATLRTVLTALGGPDPAATGPGVEPAAADEPPLPSRARLIRDTATTRARLVVRLPQGLVLLGAAVLELAGSAGAQAPKTVINRPVHSGIRLLVADVDLEAFRAAAKSRGATVNDAVLCAFGRTVHAELARRGQPVPRIVIGCPVTVPLPTTGHGHARATLQNRVGVVRLPVPAPTGAFEAVGPHLTRIAELSRPRKRHLSAASTVVLSPAFRALAALRVYRPMVDHQRSMNTLVTNLRGPAGPMTLAGRSVRSIVPVTPIVGNVPVAAVALSFGGRLSVTMRVAPDLWPSAERLRADLTSALDEICALAGATGEPVPRPAADTTRAPHPGG